MTNPFGKSPIPPDSRRIPLFHWRRASRNSETEIVVGPSVAWLIFALVALCLKGLNAVNFLQGVWKYLPW
jgi:hypothetical protein